MDIKEMEKLALQIRRDIIKMLLEAGSGHSGGSLSAVEILVCLYFSIMNHRPKDPLWEERDRFILSKGHACPVLYATLAHAGYFPLEELMTLRKLGSRLQGHPARDKGLPGIEVSTGSLGQGLSFAVGCSLSAKMDKKDNRIYCLMGDGEMDEGQIWEAAMSAAHYKLDNLCGILDFNGLQIDGPTVEVMDSSPLQKKWEAFGWEVLLVDGHNFSQLLDAFSQAKQIKFKPTIIIAKTIKGKGVSFMENKVAWHGKAPNKEEAERALEELK